VPVFLRVHTWVVLKMSKAEEAAFFKSAIGASIAASFTMDTIRDESSGEVSLQLIPGRSITVFELLPFGCDAIVTV
jgi:hypothetical protein